VATGDSTVFGRIAKLAGEPKTGLTTIETEVLRFVLLIFIIMVIWIVILAAVWYVTLYEFDDPSDEGRRGLTIY
jgi:sodium/potassium-transporting ATPase subunit alpha